MTNTFESTVKRILDFRDAREWKQFHNPKNLASSISVEAGELLEHYMWKNMEESEKHSKEAKEEIAKEVADIFIYLAQFCDMTDIDLLKAVNEKMDINDERYSVEKSKGSAKKYNEV